MSRTKSKKQVIRSAAPFRIGELLTLELKELRRRVVEYSGAKAAVDFYCSFLAEDESFIEASVQLSASKQAEMIGTIMRITGHWETPTASAWLELAEQRLWHGSLEIADCSVLAVYFEDVDLGACAVIHRASARIQMEKFSLHTVPNGRRSEDRAGRASRDARSMN
jgi:hypothetical protein